MVTKKVVPLHPLSGSDLKIPKKSSLKDLHRQRRKVVQEARGSSGLSGNKSQTVNFNEILPDERSETETMIYFTRLLGASAMKACFRLPSDDGDS